MWYQGTLLVKEPELLLESVPLFSSSRSRAHMPEAPLPRPPLSRGPLTTDSEVVCHLEETLSKADEVMINKMGSSAGLQCLPCLPLTW